MIKKKDGPCKLTCADFFREMTEQAEDLAGERGFEAPVPVAGTFRGVFFCCFASLCFVVFVKFVLFFLI